MKKSLILVFILAASVFSFAQDSVDVTAIGGTLRSPSGSEILTTTNAPVIAVTLNGTQVTGTLGTLVFTTPALDTGDFQTGATFGAGGEFVINAPGYVDYVGNFSSATWIENTLANGNHLYTLTGNLTSTEGPGSFFCQTAVLPKGGVWVTSAKLAQCQINLSLVF